MGKNSLTKSTTKGKKNAPEKKTAKKIAAKAAAKAKPAPKPKAAAKAAPAPKKKVVTMKDLLSKKFPAWKPEKLYTPGPSDFKDVAAPPFFSGPEAEQKRIKELLLKKYDMAEIKAAGEKAAAEKAAAEKAAAEKAAAEKAAAEKAAAEKAAAEKAAAEKAAAEKAAAEKAAAEKAAAEKAAAEKAAAEKAAAEKAAAEKAAAEKAAAEKAAAQAKASVSYEPPDSKDAMPPDPMDKGMKYMAAVVAVLIALVVGSSMVNQGKYYIHSKAGALEIFQGNFAPMGEKLLISLPGVQTPRTIKDVYSKTDVYPIIFNYYVDKADTLLKVPGLPDFNGIKTYINKAMPYAITPKAKDIVYSHLNDIDLMILLYKADVAAGKDTLADLNEARGFLSEASRLDIDQLKMNLIHQKIDVVDKKIATLKAEQKAAAEKAAAEKAAAEKAESSKPESQAGKPSPATAPKTESKAHSPAPHGE
jgi:colicin import membrane protein